MDFDNTTGWPVDPGLAAAAAAIDMGAAGAAHGANDPGAAAPGAAANDPAPDPLADARELLTFLHASLVPLYPSLGAIYTDPVREAIAAGVAPLMEKYAFNLGALFGKWGPEIAAAIVLVPLIAPTARAIAHDHAQARAARSKDKPAPQADPQKAAAGGPGGGIPDPNNLAAKA